MHVHKKTCSHGSKNHMRLKKMFARYKIIVHNVQEVQQCVVYSLCLITINGDYYIIKLFKQKFENFFIIYPTSNYFFLTNYQTLY
jgi:hypothetical protein